MLTPTFWHSHWWRSSDTLWVTFGKQWRLALKRERPGLYFRNLNSWATTNILLWEPHINCACSQTAATCATPQSDLQLLCSPNILLTFTTQSYHRCTQKYPASCGQFERTNLNMVNIIQVGRSSSPIPLQQVGTSSTRWGEKQNTDLSHPLLS